MSDFLSTSIVGLLDWLWQASLIFGLIAVALLLSHRRLLTQLGARSLYLLWGLLPLALCLPVLAQVSTPIFATWFESSQLITWQSWTTIPGVTAVSIDTTGADGWLLTIALLWLIPFSGMMGLFIAQYWQLRGQPCALHKGLKVQWQPAGSSPGISGFIHPRLQLPVDFSERFNRSERRLIIQHELTHWRRYDLQVNTIAWLVLACQWFNPLAWKAYQRFRADQELACDASVLATYPQHLISKQVCYANALLAAMQSVSLNARPCNLWSTAVCTHYSITQGERAMAHERFNQLNQHHQTRRWPAVLGTSLLVFAGFAWFGPVTAASMANTTLEASAPAAQQPIVRIEPGYPADVAEQGIEGHVDLSFQIDAEGKVTQIVVLDSQPKDVFSAAAVTALARWRYAPQNNLPQQIRLQFTLQND